MKAYTLTNEYHMDEIGIPIIGLVSGEPGAVYSGLLSCTDPDHLSILSITDRVGHGVLDTDRSYH